MKGIKITLIILFTIAVGGYAVFQSIDLVRGPILTITSPTDGSLFTEPLITITGTTKNISFIYLNDNQIFVDSDGVFKQKLLLNIGYNIITLRVTDRFNREVHKELHYILKEN